MWLVTFHRELSTVQNTPNIYRHSTARPWARDYMGCFFSLNYNLCSSSVTTHDDVIEWKHFPRYWPSVQGIHGFPVNSPHKGQWRGALMFSLICTRVHGWVNNGEAGDLRRHRAHYDVTVMRDVCNIISDWTALQRNPAAFAMILKHISGHCFRFCQPLAQNTNSIIKLKLMSIFAPTIQSPVMYYDGLWIRFHKHLRILLRWRVIR